MLHVCILSIFSNLMLTKSVGDIISIFTEEKTEACFKGLFRVTADAHQGQCLDLGAPAGAGIALSFVGPVSCVLFSVNFGKERVA